MKLNNNMKEAPKATPEDILFGREPRYRKVIPVPNGKHSYTYKVIKSHHPPSEDDVKFKSAHNRQGMPTGC